MKKEHSVEIQIRFNDIDMMGHVYNAKYQDFFDFARLEYFDGVLGDLITWAHKGLVIASVKVDYMQPTFFKDRIHVVTHVAKVGEKSLEMYQKIFKIGSNEPVAVCKSVMVYFDMQKRFSMRIPDEWRKLFLKTEPELNVNQPVGQN